MIFFRTLILFLFLPSIAFGAPKVLVSVAPQKYLVDRIAQGKVEVEVLVPPGASPHSYEPSLQQMLSAFNSTVWFRSGESFEIRAKEAIGARMKIVDMRDGIDLLAHKCCPGDKDAYDSHIWLSPKLLETQSYTIVQALSEAFPENAAFFSSQLPSLIQDLHQLDRYIRSHLDRVQNRVMLVSHPAFGYFCRDFDFEQLSIEMEGKEPSPRQVSNLIKRARECNIRRVFIQPQYSTKGAKRIAAELKADLVTVDPYAENPLETMRTLAHLLKYE